MEHKRGKFLALEGIDGSGKTTQQRLLLERLSACQTPCCGTREPSDGPVGALVRQFLTGRIAADNRVIAGLFASDRLDHLLNEVNGVLRALESGVTVVTDRYYFSSYAYHSVDVEMDWVIETNRLSAELLRPDLTIFLDVPVERALERIRRGRDHVELYEEEHRLRAVRENYFRAFQRLRGAERVAVIDGDGDEAAIARRVWEAVSALPD